MRFLLKTYVNQKRIMGIGTLLLALLATWLFSLPQPRASAQDGRVTHASANGDSNIISQQMVLAAGEFAETGTRDNVQVTAEGLTLAEGAGTGVYISEAIHSPLDFTTDIGPAWLADLPAGTSVLVETRLSSDGQSWGDWSAVPVEYYPVRQAEYGGVLIWANQPEVYVQFKLVLQAAANGPSPLFRRLTLFFNDTSQGPGTAAAVAQAQRENTGPASLTCPAKPLVIPRTAWGCPSGGNSPYWPPAYQPVTHVVINHTATPNSADDWAKVVRSIWHYHAYVLGWGDVGYQYLIDPLGNIYEGRAGGDDVIGAFDGYNRGAMGLGYIGCYGNCDYLGIANAQPSPAMLSAGNALMAWKVDQEELDPFGNGQYCYQTLPNIVSRSAVTCRGGSLSPGDYLDARAPEMRQAVADIIANCQEVTPTPGVTVIITIEPTTPTPTPTPTGQTPSPTATPSPTPTGGTLTPTATPSPSPTPTIGTPTSTATPSLTLTPTNTPSPTPTGPAVGLSPALLQVGLEGTGQTRVEVTNISDLYGVDFRLTYDPAVVEVVDADPNTDGVQVGVGEIFQEVESFVLKNEAGDGVINFVATRQGPAPVFSGTGELVEITWRGKTEGETPLEFSQVKVSNPDGLPLSVAVQNGQIEVVLQIVMRGWIEFRDANDSFRWGWGDPPPEIGQADGQFEVVIDPTTGAYVLTVTVPGYLTVVIKGQDFTDLSDIDLDDIILIGGEVTGDDLIDVFDLTFIGSRYGGSEATADINRDGITDIFDLTLAASNYGQQGPVTVGLELE
ncbi:MAG: N-acetylmuramoyl-L-alanine amidase [Anaerolineae bacterium]|nr:N-acetylmuramoyl-L-alanine amidase [Anaerolineae bacterium]